MKAYYKGVELGDFDTVHEIAAAELGARVYAESQLDKKYKSLKQSEGPLPHGVIFDRGRYSVTIPRIRAYFDHLIDAVEAQEAAKKALEDSKLENRELTFRDLMG